MLAIGDREALGSQLPIQWLAAAGSEPVYVGFEIQVRSLPALAALLSSRDIDFVRLDSALAVGSERACGTIVRFVEAR